MPDSEKLQKVLARAGLGSRREMERWIEERRVKVNGRYAKLGDRVSVDDSIIVDGSREVYVEQQSDTRVILYHKPIGEICTRHDPEGRTTVFERLPKLRNSRWISVGRLDIQTSGLLLLTNDGELANQLMHPKSEIEREYSVRILGEASEETLHALTHGVRLSDGLARFEHIVDGGGKGANHWYYVVCKEGRNRIVRRLWESQGHAVNRLKRVRFGPIILGSMPKQGQWTEIGGDALNRLRNSCISQ